MVRPVCIKYGVIGVLRLTIKAFSVLKLLNGMSLKSDVVIPFQTDRIL